jgi:RIO-like serine/threonine protein kinase
MVKTWAEKEMRNLARLRAAGIPAPAPLLLRMHVLVMDFIGDDGVAAPRLKVGGTLCLGLCVDIEATWSTHACEHVGLWVGGGGGG